MCYLDVITYFFFYLFFFLPFCEQIKILNLGVILPVFTTTINSLGHLISTDHLTHYTPHWQTDVRRGQKRRRGRGTDGAGSRRLLKRRSKARVRRSLTSNSLQYECRGNKPADRFCRTFASFWREHIAYRQSYIPRS